MEDFIKKEQITLFIFFLFLLLGFGFYNYFEKNKNFNYFESPILIEQLKSISKTGQLKKIDRSIIYIKVSDDYIKKIFPIFLKTISQEQKKCLQMDSNDLGAHITISKNNKRTDIGIYLKNPNYTFITKSFFNISFNHPILTSERKRVLVHETWYAIEVVSPEIINLIAKIDPTLYKKIENLEYKLHITFAVAKKIADSENCFLSSQNKRIY